MKYSIEDTDFLRKYVAVWNGLDDPVLYYLSGEDYDYLSLYYTKLGVYRSSVEDYVRTIMLVGISIKSIKEEVKKEIKKLEEKHAVEVKEGVDKDKGKKVCTFTKSHYLKGFMGKKNGITYLGEELLERHDELTVEFLKGRHNYHIPLQDVSDIICKDSTFYTDKAKVNATNHRIISLTNLL